MAGNPRRLFFTRLGVLATARLAPSACNRPEASDITEPQQAAHVLACCLMMNELTSSTAPLTGVANLQVPIYKFVEGVAIATLRIGTGQTVNYRGLRHFEVRQS